MFNEIPRSEHAKSVAEILLGRRWYAAYLRYSKVVNTPSDGQVSNA
jgi:hypothetical protein